MIFRTILAITTIIVSLIIALYLQTIKSEKRTAKITLGSILIIIALFTCSTIILSSAIYYEFFSLAYVFNITTLLLGPLFLLFSKSLLIKEPKIKSFTPAILILPITIILYFTYKTIFEDALYGKHSINGPIFIIETVQNSVFYILTPFLLPISLKHFFTDFKDNKLTAIRLLYLSLLVISIEKSITLFIFYNDRFLYHSAILVHYFIISFFSLIALYVLINHQKIFRIKPYSGSSISEASKEFYYREMINKIETMQAYLDADLSLLSLASLCDIPHKTLSQIINEKTGLNFNEFINQYRIQYACELLKDINNTKSILEIQLESGFNSKSVFNSTFKKITGVTPRFYKSYSDN